MPVWLELVLMLVLILVAAEIFTNALEHLGEWLGISEGVTGSIFAAVGTAMPESMVPLVAVLAGSSDAALNAEIGVGAILGAPLMLSTLSLCLMAASVAGRRGASGLLRPERVGLRRDLTFFLVAFGIASLSLFLPTDVPTLRVGAVILLVLVYFVYVMLTLRASAKLVEEGHGTSAHNTLFLTRLRLPEHPLTALAQCLLGLGLLIAGAKGFVHGVEQASVQFGVSALLLSLFIVPIATELPEKVNSILWIRRGKDTLAFGNITGAMVFQGSLLPAIGLSITPWQASAPVIGGVAATYCSALWLFYASRHGQLHVWQLFVGGVIYALYLTAMLVA